MPAARPSMVNGGYQQPSYAAYQQPAQQARTCHHTTTQPGGRKAYRDAGPQYFFKESPFFEIREMLLNNITLDSKHPRPHAPSPSLTHIASPSHRQTVNKNLTLNDAQCGRLRSDPTLRILLFCALDQPLAPYTRMDIAFPSQIEVRVNQDEVKANYKGLKNKPGSTRPADITSLLRTAPANYRNSISITYALTQKASPEEVSYPLPLFSCVT